MRRLQIASIAFGALVSHCSIVTDFEGVVEGSEAGNDSSSGASGAAGSGGGSGGGVGGLAGGAGSDAGADAGDSAGDAACDGSALGGDYELRQLPPTSVVTIDGVCNEPFWAKLPTFPFTGTNTTDNGISCRFAWADGTPPVQYGCCEVSDADLRAEVSQPDGDVFADDGIDLMFKGNTAQTVDATTTRVVMNLLETVKDSKGPLPWDETHDAQVQVKVQLDGSLNSIGTDTGYVVEWRFSLGFPVVAPQLGLCQVMLNDRDVGDGGSKKTGFIAFGSQISNPQHWGTCVFSCAP